LVIYIDVSTNALQWNCLAPKLVILVLNCQHLSDLTKLPYIMKMHDYKVYLYFFFVCLGFGLNCCKPPIIALVIFFLKYWFFVSLFLTL